MGATSDQDARLARLGRLRAAVLADAALCAALVEIWRPDLFAARLAAVAEARGVALAPGEIEELLHRGLAPGQLPSRFRGAPPRGWRPAEVATAAGQPTVRWAHFGERRLAEPSYSASLAAVALRPFNRLFGFATGLAELTAPSDGLAPAGLVFHMSRCGSTLVAQMLAASPLNVVVAEAPPIDAVVRMDRAATGLAAREHADRLEAMVLALARPCAGERRSFVKLDSWHIGALALFRTAFPRTPWVFLYRDPVEVMVSQLQAFGMQMSPQQVPPAWLGLGDAGDEPRDGAAEDYAARVLGALCAAAASAHQRGGGLLVNYSELPQALVGRILPHFGVVPSAAEAAAMAAAAGRDAKRPGSAFVSDSAAKQAGASDAIRAAVARHVAEPYARLEALRRRAA